MNKWSVFFILGHLKYAMKAAQEQFQMFLFFPVHLHNGKESCLSKHALYSVITYIFWINSALKFKNVHYFSISLPGIPCIHIFSLIIHELHFKNISMNEFHEPALWTRHEPVMNLTTYLHNAIMRINFFKIIFYSLHGFNYLNLIFRFLFMALDWGEEKYCI